jgi:putative membrane protein
MKRNWILVALVVIASVILGINPKADRMTWALENAPIWLGLIILYVTRHRFPLTPLVYYALAVHALILMVGGHYTYAKVPLGDWAKDFFGLARNHYDRLGHLAQGFIPALITREILVRVVQITRHGWLFFLCVCVCLAISAFYEFIEWWVAVATGEAANDFLGTQGDAWDTQWDMFMCMVGAMLALTFLSKIHDRQLDQRGFSGKNK